jgi:hypothetical protein
MPGPPIQAKLTDVDKGVSGNTVQDIDPALEMAAARYGHNVTSLLERCNVKVSLSADTLRDLVIAEPEDVRLLEAFIAMDVRRRAGLSEQSVDDNIEQDPTSDEPNHDAFHQAKHGVKASAKDGAIEPQGASANGKAGKGKTKGERVEADVVGGVGAPQGSELLGQTSAEPTTETTLASYPYVSHILGSSHESRFTDPRSSNHSPDSMPSLVSRWQ